MLFYLIFFGLSSFFTSPVAFVADEEACVGRYPAGFATQCFVFIATLNKQKLKTLLHKDLIGRAVSSTKLFVNAIVWSPAKVKCAPSRSVSQS
jgi:hypothetical protein